MKTKWLSIVSGVVLLLAIPSGVLPYSFYSILRWFICISAVILSNGYYLSNLIAGSLIFGAIAFLFNPFIPIVLDKSSWVSIDFISAIIFFLAAQSIKKK